MWFLLILPTTRWNRSKHIWQYCYLWGCKTLKKTYIWPYNVKIYILLHKKMNIVYYFFPNANGLHILGPEIFPGTNSILLACKKHLNASGFMTVPLLAISGLFQFQNLQALTFTHSFWQSSTLMMFSMYGFFMPFAVPFARILLPGITTSWKTQPSRPSKM